MQSISDLNVFKSMNALTLKLHSDELNDDYL